MYICGICGAKSQPGQPRLLHCLYRPKTLDDGTVVVKGSIAREIPVCIECHGDLGRGWTLNELRERCKQAVEEPETVQKPSQDKLDWIAQARPLNERKEE